MRNTKKDPKEHGIISVVQSPDNVENDTSDVNKLDTENEPDEPKEHGIISVVQSPDKVENSGNE